MKKFALSNEQAQHLYIILNDNRHCPMKNIAEMKKLTSLLNVIKPSIITYEKARMALRENYKEKQVEENGKKILPAIFVDELDKALTKLDKEEHNYECDREAFSFCKYMYEGTPERAFKEAPTGEKTGMGGADDSRLFTEVSDALEKATEAK